MGVVLGSYGLSLAVTAVDWPLFDVEADDFFAGEELVEGAGEAEPEDLAEPVLERGAMFAAAVEVKAESEPVSAAGAGCREVGAELSERAG